MKRALIVAFILSVATLAFADAAPTKPTLSPEWCKPGWICVHREEIVADANFHLDLREQVQLYRSRARRFGLTVGPGIGIAAVVDDRLDVRYLPTTGVFLTWGLRF